MSILEVPGAHLYHETCGGGPLMVMVPGAGGSADSFKLVREGLAAGYTVITYDRRGFSRSGLDGPQDYDHRLETDADDIRQLIEHYGDEPATVVGSSSGGIVALEVLTRHPSVVARVVPLEPPAVKQLPDGERWVDFFYEVYDLYRQSGIEAALERFRHVAFAESDRLIMARVMDLKRSEYVLANATYWFEHELRQYPAVDLDLHALREHSDRIVLAVGQESRGYPCYLVNVELAKKLGRDLIELPGGHVGFVTRPADFAGQLLQALGQDRIA